MDFKSPFSNILFKFKTYPDYVSKILYAYNVPENKITNIKLINKTNTFNTCMHINT